MLSKYLEKFSFYQWKSIIPISLSCSARGLHRGTGHSALNAFHCKACVAVETSGHTELSTDCFKMTLMPFRASTFKKSAKLRKRMNKENINLKMFFFQSTKLDG